LEADDDDEGAELVGLSRSAGPAALLRAVVLLRDELGGAAPSLGTSRDAERQATGEFQPDPGC
jgi:hypothetical protein